MDPVHWIKERLSLRNRYIALFDVVGLSAAFLLAYAVRFESLLWPGPHEATFLRALPVLVAFKVALFYGFGLYRRIWRHAGVAELERIVTVSTISAFAVVVLGVWLLPALGLLVPRVPVSVAFLDAALTPIVIAMPRFAVRWLAQHLHWHAGRERRRILIVGAGSAGEIVARELNGNQSHGLVPVGFVDDDPSKHGLEMCGLKVLGPISQLAEFRDRTRADELVIAMPSAAGSAVRETMRLARAVGMQARTVPGVFEILSGRVSLSSLRPVQIDDLLRREPVRTDLDRVQEMVDGRTVLVTGAGGSIGAELCRQVSAFQPSKLVVLGHGENSIFNVTAELTELFPSLEVVPLIADVRDREQMFRRLEPHCPDVVFHAAAHKHVPLMELNVGEAVSNNVLGTRNVAEVAARLGCARLVLISSDKAVRPTNVMGATKRVAEQIVQNIAEYAGQPYIAVRFGNVLGSRGSVVPVFLRQIAAGGPITITHPEMRRYFMTIPESVQLVLQAAVQGQGGEVFVLDMGDPVKIVDLAADLVRLSGLEVGRDIEINFTGVRPGEKLYEELFFGREHAEPTEHPKILRAKHAQLPLGVSSVIEELIARGQQGASDQELRTLLHRLVPDYHPEDSPHNVTTSRGLPAGVPMAQSPPVFIG
ncbi:MAG: polysaccharide biosynthesis protein [Gemmatimonadales bacterium]